MSSRRVCTRNPTALGRIDFRVEFRFALTADEFAELSVVCLRLSDHGPVVARVRRISITVALLGIPATAVLAWLTDGFAGCTFVGGLAAALLALLTSEAFRRRRNRPEGPVEQGVRLTEEGVTDLVREGGPELFLWPEIERREDIGWAWLFEIDTDEWVALPKRVVPPEQHSRVAALAAAGMRM